MHEVFKFTTFTDGGVTRARVTCLPCETHKRKKKHFCCVFDAEGHDADVLRSISAHSRGTTHKSKIRGIESNLLAHGFVKSRDEPVDAVPLTRRLRENLDAARARERSLLDAPTICVGMRRRDFFCWRTRQAEE